MTYWLYSAITNQNGRDVNFSGVVKSENQFFPLKKVMESHFLVTGLSKTNVGNAVEISEEDYNYFYSFAEKMNMQQIFLS